MTSILEYLEFDLLISGKADGSATAHVVSSPMGEASCQFTLPFEPDELHAMVHDLVGTRFRSASTRSTEDAPKLRDARAPGPPGSPRREIARSLGSRLYDTVFAGEVGTTFRRSLDTAQRKGKGLRIRLQLVEAPSLAEIPWEYLYVEGLGRFLALSRETPIVRYLGIPQKVPPLAVPPPLRILLVVSAPVDLVSLDHADEVSRIRSVLADRIDHGEVVLTPLAEPSFTKLRRALRRADYHVLHFVGHGGYLPDTEAGGLFFEDDDRRSHLVSGGSLATLLQNHPSLRLAVLNSCEGARQSPSNAFSGVAQSLVGQGLPAVVAMQFEIADDAARVFAEEFYSAVVDRYPVDAALAEARLALFEGDNDGEWGTPVLHLRARDGQIFAPQAGGGAASGPVSPDGPATRVNSGETMAAPFSEVGIQSFVVHESGDSTEGIPNAEVRLALPSPVTMPTGPGGEANFRIAPDDFGKYFHVKASKPGYLPFGPELVGLERGGYAFLPLRRSTTPGVDEVVTQDRLNVARHAPKSDSREILIYDSQEERPAFRSWTGYSSVGGTGQRIFMTARDDDEASSIRLRAYGLEDVGVDKSCRAINGRAEFEYRVLSSGASGPNITFCMIPMQNTGVGRRGLIEVGTDHEDDPRNAWSPLRARYTVPPIHIRDGQWHHGSIDFDFRLQPDAFYSIFAPRLNEGSPFPGPAEMVVSMIRLYLVEGS